MMRLVSQMNQPSPKKHDYLLLDELDSQIRAVPETVTRPNFSQMQLREVLDRDKNGQSCKLHK